jgi:hypothetical protein
VIDVPEQSGDSLRHNRADESIEKRVKIDARHQSLDTAKSRLAMRRVAAFDDESPNSKGENCYD